MQPLAHPRIAGAEAVIVGSGMAGLVAALRLAPRPVTLLTKTAVLEGGSSALAQGGIAAAVGEGDSPEDHAADTVGAGAGLADEAMAALLACDGAEQVLALLNDGLPFDRAPDGRPLLGREAAHGRARVLHAGGDATGRTLVRALIERVRRTPSIRVVERVFAVDLVVHDGRVGGLLAWHGDDGWVFHRCPRVVLATGGIGATFLRTTNPAEATGDGLAMAARAGARLADLEFVQFHPTALAAGGGADGRMGLLTEALRGEGAWLLDGHGRRFMPDEHPLAELAPRDVVARAVWRRVAAGRPVHLDLRPIFAGDGADHFPTVLGLCREAGIDPSTEPVPVAPAAHYHMGGVVTDASGRTSIDGLWACGEVACTGVHGANRLASNSLLEALVFGDRVARDLGRRPLAPLAAVAVPDIPAVPGLTPAELDAMVDAARRLMYEKAGLFRDGAGLAEGLAGLTALARRLDGAPRATVPAAGLVTRWGELRNRLLVGRLVTQAALNRRESRGAHCRDDHPRPVAAWCRHQILTIADLPPIRIDRDVHDPSAAAAPLSHDVRAVAVPCP